MKGLPLWLLSSSYASVDPEAWARMPSPEREELKARWRAAGAAAPPLWAHDAFGRAVDAMIFEDESAFVEALERKAPSVDWRAPSGGRIGQRDIEVDPNQPLVRAARLACFGPSRWLELALPRSTPMTKIAALELICGQPGLPHAASALGFVLASMEAPQTPEGGWPEARRLRSLKGPAEARSLKDALLWCQIFPFGRAFEIAAGSGFAEAIRSMGDILGPQANPEPTRPDRLRSGGYFGRCCQSGENGFPSLMAALHYAPRQSALAGLDALKRPGDFFGAERRGIRDRLVAAVEAKLDELRLRSELDQELPAGAPRRAATRV